MIKSLNWLVRYYLRRFPITEGKSQLLKFMKNLITPEDAVIEFETKYDFSLKANLRDHKHLRLYFYGAHDERYEIHKALKIIRGGDTCWDIGANIGFYTCLFASLVGEKGNVVAFEPASITYDYLSENVLTNRFTNVQLIKKAVGDCVGRKSIYYSHPNLAKETASLKYFNENDMSEMVDVDTIDNLLSELPAPDFLKIDVEGYQMEVLRGGYRFLTTHYPLILVELKDSADANQHCLGDVAAELVDWGYCIYEVRKSSLKKCHDLAAAKLRNFLLVNEDSRYFSRIRSLL